MAAIVALLLVRTGMPAVTLPRSLEVGVGVVRTTPPVRSGTSSSTTKIGSSPSSRAGAAHVIIVTPRQPVADRDDGKSGDAGDGSSGDAQAAGGTVTGN